MPKLNILYGFLILALIVTIFTENTDNDLIRLSPSQQDLPPKLDSDIGLLHFSCNQACWYGDKCKEAISYKEDNKFVCECNSCETIDSCKLYANDRTKFIWTC